ncbi:hypothetical protein ES702_01588 [subsurface metagenome]
MNPAKRRRLDATASTLRKPFRSPLKVPADDPASPKPTVTSNLDQQRPDPSPSPALSRSRVHDSPIKPSRASQSPNKLASKHSPSRPIDEVVILQKQYSALTQELRRLRQDLDVAEQARKLRLNSQTQQLEHLISKWREIARSAADEVFDITSSRVKDMGGIQAWQKNTQESSQSWFDSGTSSRDHTHNREERDGQDEHPDTTRANNGEDEDEELDHQKEVSCDVVFKSVSFLIPN